MQFTSNLFGDYCNDMGIKLCFASVVHPGSNGQADNGGQWSYMEAIIRITG